MLTSKANYVSLTDQHRCAGKEVVAKFGSKPALAFFSGSIAAGLGHVTSDLDIHVVLGDAAKLPRSTYMLNDCRIQITYVDEQLFLGVSELCREFVATKADRTQAELSPDILWNISRTASSELVSGSKHMTAAYRAVRRSVARKILLVNFARPVGNLTQDSFGFLEIGDIPSAYAASVLALRNATEALLAGFGDLYAVEKFAIARLARSQSADICDFLWKSVYAGALQPTESTVRNNLWAANSLASSALLTGWDVDMKSKPSTQPVGGGPVRSPFWSLLRFSDCFALAGPNASLRISEAVARMWNSLDGRNLPEVIDVSAGDAGSEAASRALDRLIETSAVLR
jgi:hypothetical protein